MTAPRRPPPSRCRSDCGKARTETSISWTVPPGPCERSSLSTRDRLYCDGCRRVSLLLTRRNLDDRSRARTLGGTKGARCPSRKRMKKLIGAISAIFCLSGAAFAAPTHGSHSLLRGRSLWLGVDTEFGIPLGNYSDANSVGYGAVFTAEYALLEMLGATARIGFEGHMDRAIGANLSAHVHAIPVLLGTKYYIGPDRAGLFGAFELGMFDLMSSVESRAGGGRIVSATSNDLKFGLGVGVGYQQDRWNARVNIHSQDIGNFGSAMIISGGIGYHFASF